MSESLRVIVVDDEPLAREGLRLRLEWLGGVTVVAECASAEEGLTALAAQHVDVAFVDIQMPGVTGFGLLERLERDLLPAIILVSAHGEHALRAFRVGVFDYLLKPFDDRTLRASVERARTFVTVVRGGAGDGADDATASRPARVRESILVKTDGRVVVLSPGDIEWVEATGDHVRIHAGAQSHRLRSTMRAMESRLDPARFIRVHRGAIVAVPAIRELQPYSRGEHLVVLADGTKLPLSRRQLRRVRELLEPAR